MRINKLISFAVALSISLGVMNAVAEEQDAANANSVAASSALAPTPAAPASLAPTPAAPATVAPQATAPAAPAAPAAAPKPAAPKAAAPKAAEPKMEVAATKEKKDVKPQPDERGFIVGGPVYVSDKSKVWTRSGPGEGYRLTGSRVGGDKLTFLRYSDNGRWAQLQDEDNTFWMNLESLTPEICGDPLVEQLRQEIDALKYRLDNYDNELMVRAKKAEDALNKLTKENAELKATLVNKEATITELDELYRDYAERLETKDLDMQMRWWLQGAIIALGGAIAGIIFVFIPRPTRSKKRDRY